MIPRQYQAELSDAAVKILLSRGIVYLAMEERTGKTLTAILTAEKSPAQHVLVLTKKAALTGWRETLDAYKPDVKFTLTNYSSAHKVSGKFDLVICDEAHNYISGYPKPSNTHKLVRQLVGKCPVIYMSATPHAQGYQMLFHQFSITPYSPWRSFKNFYAWFETYGKPYTREINGFDVKQYDRVHEDKIKEDIDGLFIVKTRAELGFEHEPEDQVHYIDLDQTTRDVYNFLLAKKWVEFRAGKLVCESKSKLRYALHMLEGGVAKLDDKYITLANDEKVRYILNKFGDSADLVIMYNYIQEAEKLKQHFKHALILQATRYAEGVDLHKYKHLVVYSQDFSTARHTQRRARQCNLNRDTPITVHFLLVRKAISEQVYKTVSVNKKNFVDSVFKETLI